MKKTIFFCVILSCLCAFVGCSPQADNTADPCPATFSAAEYDLSDVRAICLGSGTTGKSMWLTEKADIDAILAAVAPLVGTDPISSRGYYGWNYDFAFYVEAEPTEHDTPLLTFSVADYGNAVYLAGSAVFEEVSGVSYKTLYTLERDAAEALFTACEPYKEALGEAEPAESKDSLQQPIPPIELTGLKALPHGEEEARFSAAPVGGNPKMYFFDDGLTFYFRQYRSTQSDAEYFCGTLTLPDGFTDGKVVSVMNGAGSGELFVLLEAMREERKEYLAYAFFGTESPTVAYVLDEKQTERLLSQIKTEVLERTQGPFVGYIADRETPWIELYTEKNGICVAQIPYEIFKNWPATDREYEGWTPGWRSEYTCFYYAEFGDFRWAAVYLSDTVLGAGRKNVAVSSDGGKNWTCGSYSDNYGGNHVVGIGFVSEKVAFMSFDPYNEAEATGGPVISRTVDGGKTWERLDIPVPDALNATKLIAGVPYYDRDILRYPVWRSPSHGVKEGEPLYLVSHDGGLTFSWDASSLPTESTRYTVEMPLTDARDFITVAGVYGKYAEPNYPDGNILHAGKDGTLYYVMGVGNEWWSRGNFKSFRTYRVTSGAGCIESVEECETFTKSTVLKNGKPYSGSLGGLFTCQAYRFVQGNFNYDFWSHSVYITDSGAIYATAGMVGTGGPIRYEGSYRYDEKTGDFTAKLVGRYASEGNISLYPEAEVKGKLYEYGGFVHFICESSGVSTLTVNDPLPLTFVPNTDGYADPAVIVLDNTFDGVWLYENTEQGGNNRYQLSVLTESAQIRLDDLSGNSRYTGTYTVNPLTNTITAKLRSETDAKAAEFTLQFTLGYSRGTNGTFLYLDVSACDAPTYEHLVGKMLAFRPVP